MLLNDVIVRITVLMKFIYSIYIIIDSTRINIDL